MKDVPRPGAGPSSRFVNGTRFLSFAISADTPDIPHRVQTAFSGIPLAHLIVFASPSVDFARLIEDLHARFRCPVAGCTSAAEISGDGFVEDHVVIIGLPNRWFAARTVLIENLSTTYPRQINDMLVQNRMALTATNPRKSNGFSFLMLGGSSGRHTQLVDAMSSGISGFPLFGGTAGGGLPSHSAGVAYEGRVYNDAATLTYVVTPCDIHVFSINHMVPSGTRMVVTDAAPDDRLIRRMNDEPAAIEYARLIGRDPRQLDEFTLAQNPLNVHVGGKTHVRAIERMTEDGHLIFSSAIGEGTVLSVAQAQDMAAHLDAELTGIINGYGSAEFLVCDCIGRRIEAQNTQSWGDVNGVLKKHGVSGFSSYGQQFGTEHMNRTLAGVALFPPDAGG